MPVRPVDHNAKGGSIKPDRENHSMTNYPVRYRDLIDAEIWSFIEKTESFYPADAVDGSVDYQRRVYNQMCQAFTESYPKGIDASENSLQSRSADGQIAYVKQRCYTSSKTNDDCVVLYFHGGGFVVGDLDSHDSVCADICDSTHLRVVSTDYRLLPESSALSAYEDALNAFDHACQRHAKIILCGDSAGANLCAAVAHTDKRRKITHRIDPEKSQLAGQVLIYPGLGGSLNSASALEHCEAPMLTRSDVEYYESLRHSKNCRDYRIRPLKDTDFSNLPVTHCFSAQCDPLADDGKAYCNRITNAGGTAHFTCEQGLVHGYLRARHCSSRALLSFNRICAAISALT